MVENIDYEKRETLKKLGKKLGSLIIGILAGGSILKGLERLAFCEEWNPDGFPVPNVSKATPCKPGNRISTDGTKYQVQGFKYAKLEGKTVHAFKLNTMNGKPFGWAIDKTFDGIAEYMIIDLHKTNKFTAKYKFGVDGDAKLPAWVSKSNY